MVGEGAGFMRLRSWTDWGRGRLEGGDVKPEDWSGDERGEADEGVGEGGP
jgi:hypothetical protein